MAIEKSFFAVLVESKHSSDKQNENKSDIINDLKKIGKNNDNDWLQEYELIYRDYALESYIIFKQINYF